MIRPCKTCKGNGFVGQPQSDCGCRSAMCEHTPVFFDPESPLPGLYQKFWVRRTDGSSASGKKHEACDFLVLDWVHDPYAVAAGLAYAKACESEYPELAADIRRRVKSASDRAAATMARIAGGTP